MTTLAACSAGSPSRPARELGEDVLDVVARLADLEPLADADDRGEAVLVCRGDLGVHRLVGLGVVLAPLAVPDRDVGAAELGEQGAADLAGVGAARRAATGPARRS